MRGGSPTGGHHLVGRVAQGVVRGDCLYCSGVERCCELGDSNGGVDKCIASSAGAVVATRRICTSLTADSKLLTLVQIVAGAIVLSKSES